MDEWMVPLFSETIVLTDVCRVRLPRTLIDSNKTSWHSGMSKFISTGGKREREREFKGG